MVNEMSDGEELTIADLRNHIDHLEDKLKRLTYLVWDVAVKKDAFIQETLDADLELCRVKKISDLLVEAAKSVDSEKPMTIHEFRRRVWQIVPERHLDTAFADKMVLTNAKHGRYNELHDHFVKQGMSSVRDLLF